jgi:HSP20 family protein
MMLGEELLPDIDVFEREGAIVVRADMPGMKREDIDITLEGDMLVVRGHREADTTIEEDDYYCREREAGEFSRSLRVPEGVKADSIEASYADGVLEVRIPRPAPSESRSVKVPIK